MVDGHCSMLMLIIVITLLAQLVSRIAANCIYDLCGACPLNENKIVPSGSGIAIFCQCECGTYSNRIYSCRFTCLLCCICANATSRINLNVYDFIIMAMLRC